MGQQPSLYRLLQERQRHLALFAEGGYILLVVEGAYRDHILAFARRYESTWRLVIVPLHTARICQEQGKASLTMDWIDTLVVLPTEAPTRWINQLSNITDAYLQD